MTEDLAKLRRRLPPWMKPWIPVATLLAIGILGYSYFVATRYWDASGEVTSLTNRLSAVPRIPSEGLEVEKALQDDAISQEQRLEGVRSLFSNLQADELMALAAETGQKARVAVESITVAPLKTETSEEIRYQAYPMTITLLGQATDIFQFISMMNSQVPTEVKDIRIGGLDGDGAGPPPNWSLAYMYRLSLFQISRITKSTQAYMICVASETRGSERSRHDGNLRIF